MNDKEIIAISNYEDEILDLIENQEDMTRSDLQGVVGALVMNIYRTGVSRDLLDFDEALRMHKNEFASKFR